MISFVLPPCKGSSLSAILRESGLDITYHLVSPSETMKQESAFLGVAIFMFLHVTIGPSYAPFLWKDC